MDHLEDRELREVLRRVRAIEAKVDLILGATVNDSAIEALTKKLAQSEVALENATKAAEVQPKKKA